MSKLPEHPRSAKYRRLTEEQKQTAIAAYLAGATSDSIGGRFGVSGAAIRTLMRSRGIPGHTKNKLTDAQRAVIAAAYLAGDSSERLAKQYHVTGTTIRRTLVGQGVILRRAEKQLRFLSDEERWGVYDLYQSGVLMPELARRFDVDVGTISDILHKRGVPVRRRVVFKPGEEQEAIAAYQSGRSAADVAKGYGISPGAVHRIVRDAGLESRTSTDYRKRSLNEHAFDGALTNEVAAYWVGFLLGDGTVRRNRSTYAISLALAARDERHIIAFQSFLGSDHKIGRYVCDSFPGTCKPSSVVKLAVSSRRLGDILVSFGVGPNKSHSARAERGIDSLPAFWRGVVDADGTVQMEKRRGGSAVLFLAGSRPLMEQFEAFVKGHLDTKAKVRPHSSIWAFGLTGWRAAQIIRLLYQGATVALHRKNATAKKILAASRIITK